MSDRRHQAHPYIPNSAPDSKRDLMAIVGIEDTSELFADIPEGLRVRGKLNVPKALKSESVLKRHIESILSRNRSCRSSLSFLGGGCYYHYVPAICDEINQRSEFLTAYTGDPYADHGKWQALFEYASLMGELLNMDVVSVPTYDWAQAAATSIRMASRITGRREALVSGAINPERLLVMKNYCKSDVDIRVVGYDEETGLLRLGELRRMISSSTAAVYFENPNYFGTLEQQGKEISSTAQAHGCLSLVGVDPISLGIIAPPADYGADIVVGDLQPLGVHMQFGGGLSGFIATHDKERFVMEYPSRLAVRVTNLSRSSPTKGCQPRQLLWLGFLGRWH